MGDGSPKPEGAIMNHVSQHGPLSTHYAVDAHGPAQRIATDSGLPQTVFYHPDLAHSCAAFGATILRDQKTRQLVTWLPENYFEGWKS
jgi:hypothetical protein